MDIKSQIRAKIKENEKIYLDLLFELLKQPSISSQNVGVDECAILLKKQMEDIGIETHIYETSGSPVVYGEIMKPENKFTILMYGHYDVQPPEPLNEWVSPPFEPTIRNGKIYARGVGDNKGQMLAHVLAVKTLQDLGFDIPVNIKFLFDGEEENGSPNLRPFMEENTELLKADFVYRSDGPLDSSGAPIINLGGRGVVQLELSATGADRDHHSGNKGNVVPNPAWSLIHLLSTLKTPDGKVLVEGFYDDVRELTEDDINIIRKNPFNAAEKAKTFGLKELNMDGETYFRNISVEPTFNINGFSSGFVGEGHKAIIPSKATVRLDIRLVADQKPEDISKKVIKHIKEKAPDVMVSKYGAFEPFRVPTNIDVVKKVINLVKITYEKEPLIFLASGASSPGNILTDVLKVPSIGVPYANADEDNHAPNENMDIDLFYKGIEASCNVFVGLATKD